MTTSRLKVRVVADRCQGHNRCRLIAPTLFELDEHGYARAKGDGLVPPELVDKAKLAASNCPEFAIEAVPVQPGQ
jgi:ferredoxin